VYNRNRGAVKTDVSLAGTAGPTYSLVINGDAGPSATGITIRGQDSLLVLVRAVLGDNGQATVAKKYLITDQLNFRTNGNEQNVKLVAYGQNAYFHRADYITTNTTWATDKPHVIVNASRTIGGIMATFGVLVGQGATLTIPKGARIYSHAGSYLQVDGRLLVGQDFVPGTAATDTVKANNPNIVRFQGDRLEPYYAEIPGQWGGIVFTSTSRGNRIRYAEIKNATFGALLYNQDNAAATHPDLTVENTVIRNISGADISFANTTASSGGGILSYSGDVTATNCLFTNCGEYAMLGVGGGVYNLNFCTIANYTPSFRREAPFYSLGFSNELAGGNKIKAPISVSIRNSIVWGSYEDELFFDQYQNGDPTYAVSVVNNLLRTKEYDVALTPATKLNLGAASTGNILNEDPLFKRTSLVSSRPDYSLQPTSRAVSRPRVGTGPDRDIRNLPRKSAPSLGAYEFN
jgi:hypothetical protein